MGHARRKRGLKSVQNDSRRPVGARRDAPYHAGGWRRRPRRGGTRGTGGRPWSEPRLPAAGELLRQCGEATVCTVRLGSASGGGFLMPVMTNGVGGGGRHGRGDQRAFSPAAGSGTGVWPKALEVQSRIQLTDSRHRAEDRKRLGERSARHGGNHCTRLRKLPIAADCSLAV